MDAPNPASIALRRRIEWMDTDAAGIYHWTTAFRLAEAAEAALHTALGFADITFGATPRVRVQADFTRSLRFNDAVDVTLAVAAVGRTSVRYRLAIAHDGAPVAEGEIDELLHRPGDGPRDPVAGPRARGTCRRRGAAAAGGVTREALGGRRVVSGPADREPARGCPWQTRTRALRADGRDDRGTR